MKINELKDEFLSEEDLDLRNLSWEELIQYWNQWLEQAQISNDLDEFEYSHGVFMNINKKSLLSRRSRKLPNLSN
jgi:hypothetical protein